MMFVAMLALLLGTLFGFAMGCDVKRELEKGLPKTGPTWKEAAKSLGLKSDGRVDEDEDVRYPGC